MDGSLSALRRPRAGLRHVALVATVGAAVAIAAIGVHAGNEAAGTERRQLLDEERGSLESAAAVAAARLRGLLADRPSSIARELGIAVDVGEARWRPSVAPEAPPAFAVADANEFVEHRPLEALAAWRRALELPLDATARSVAFRNVARLSRESGDDAGAHRALTAALALARDRAVDDREALLSEFDAARRASPTERAALASAIATNAYEGAPPSARLTVYEHCGKDGADVPALVATSRLVEGGAREAQLADVGGGRVAWRLESGDGADRFGIASSRALLAALLPSVRDHRAEVNDSGKTSLPLPFPALRLGPTATFLADADVEARDAAASRRTPALALAILLFVAAVLFEADARRRDAARARENAFLLSVTHELLTPIANVRLYADTIATHGSSDPSSVPKFAAVVASEADRLRDRVREILDVAGGRPLAPARSTFLPASLLHALADERRAFHPSRPLLVDVPPGDAATLARGTEPLARRVVSSLVDNALKFATAGPVQLSMRRVGGVVELRVSDEGPGIPTADRERVFEPFTRLDGAVASASPGTGLGLALARRLAQACGGTVSVEDAAPPGTTMKATFPVAEGTS